MKDKLLSILLVAATVFLSGSASTKIDDKTMLIYVADPMCSWCYGFSPEITIIKNEFEETMGFQLVMGGLRPGGTEVMDADMKKFLSHHWDQVNRRTGQPFNHNILDDKTFVYDTEPAARAVVTTRILAPEKEFDYFKKVQTAFYADNKNTNETATFVALAKEMGMDEKKFEELFTSDTLEHETAADFLFARKLRATGFPTLLVKKGDTYHVITVGYDKHEKLIRKINKVLEKE